MGFIMSYDASNAASAIITCQIAATLAIGAGFNPIPPILAAGLASYISSAIPSSTHHYHLYNSLFVKNSICVK